MNLYPNIDGLLLGKVDRRLPEIMLVLCAEDTLCLDDASMQAGLTVRRELVGAVDPRGHAKAT